MARPRLISDEQILEVAHEVFLEQGFSATTAEIARRASVSEGTLFKRFPNKVALFEAAVGLTDYPLWREEFLSLVRQGSVRENLEQGMLLVLDRAARIVPNIMAVFSRGHDPAHNPMLQQLEHPSQHDVETFAAYLRSEAEVGRVQKVDFDVTALVIVGTLTHYIHREQMMPCKRQPTLDRERFVKGLLDAVWPALEKDDSKTTFGG